MDANWELVVEARRHWQRGLDKLDAYIRANSHDAIDDLTGSMKIVYQIIKENHHLRRITRKKVVRIATPVIKKTYPENRSIEQTIQNAIKRLCDRGLLAKAGYGAYRLP